MHILEPQEINFSTGGRELLVKTLSLFLDISGGLGHDSAPDGSAAPVSEQQRRTRRARVLIRCGQGGEQRCLSVGTTAWAPCLAQAVARTTSSRSKLTTTMDKPSLCSSVKKSSRVMGEQRDKIKETPKRHRHLQAIPS